MTRHLPLLIAILLLAIAFLGGCALPIAGAMTIGQLSTILSVGLTAATGKGLTEHAMDAATGKDCNILGSVIDKDRALCEVRGSEATKQDFKGFFNGDEAPPPARKPVLVRVNGQMVYTMAPVVRAGDIANAEAVRALPPAAPPRHSWWGGDPARAPKPVLVRIRGELIYTMAPVARAADIHVGTTAIEPVQITPARHP